MDYKEETRRAGGRGRVSNCHVAEPDIPENTGPNAYFQAIGHLAAKILDDLSRRLAKGGGREA